MEPSSVSDPFKVLGLSNGAGEEEIRARYLELVRKFPPERDPEKFSEIRAAFETAKDPLVMARQLVSPPERDAPDWLSAVTDEEAERNPAILTPDFLLSLGNRDASDGNPQEESPR